MSKMTLDGGLKEAHRHLIQVMTDAKMSGCDDMAADVEQARVLVHRIRERYRTAHPNARMVGSCQQRIGAA